ncbi:MAG: magnesium transporter, partial [Methanomicrobium sp.]|nr:magnesium transporter [Methanomicrobium sp.]
PGREVFRHFLMTYLYVCILMPILALLADYFAVHMGMESPGIWVMLFVSLAAGLIVITFVNLIGYLTASLSFRKGFDPDNFGIPVITSFIDLLGASVLVTIISIVV